MVFFIIFIVPILFITLTYFVLTVTTVTKSLLVISTTPMLLIHLNKLIYKNQTNLFQMLGVILSLIGVSYVITKGNYQNIFDSKFYSGDLFILLAVISWALYSIFLKKNETGVSGFSFLYLSFVFTVILLLPVYLYDVIIQNNCIAFDHKTLLVIGYTGTFPSILSYICWNTGVALIGPKKSGPFLNLMHIFGGILAYLVFQETLQSYHYAGILSVIVGIMIANKE